MASFKNQGFDHVEFIVEDIRAHAKMYEAMGFEKIGERNLSSFGLITEAWAQGFVRILLTKWDGNPAAQSHSSVQFFKKHGDGITTLAVEVDNTKEVYEKCLENGAQSVRAPETFTQGGVTLTKAEIFTPADLRYVFIERSGVQDFSKPSLLDEHLSVSRLESPSPLGIRVIDHLTNNVGIGEMSTWVEWYKKIFNFKVTRHFHIKTGRTGLISDVVESQDRKIKVPVNEATEPESQVQEFVNRFKGPGVQHLAFLTTDIISTIKTLRQRDFKFLSVPSTYYEQVESRVPDHKEDLAVLEDLGILIDGEKEGYLLQLFTEEMVGPFFFEYIQRKGNQGFGEGNFKALFEAIERDQIKRGVLKG